MKTKVIKQEIENWLITAQYPIDAKAALQKVLFLIDSMQEEPVSKIWHDVREMPNFDRIVVFHYIDGVSSCQYCGQSMKGVLDWCYLDDLFNKQEEPDLNWKDMSIQEKKDLIASLQKDIIESIGEETMIYQGETYTRVYKDRLDEYACKYPKSIPLPSKKFRRYSDIDLTIAIKAGAKWQKEQMINSAKKSKIVITSGGILLSDLKIEDFDYADKVKVIIIKENKDE